MKSEFVKTWNSSVQPRKQRKFRFNAPLHVRSKFMSVNLSKELRKKIGSRNVIVKKGDKVKVMRGQHKKKTGKVERITLKRERIYVAGIDMNRKDGTKSLIPLRPSNLQIMELDTSGKNRFKKED